MKYILLLILIVTSGCSTTYIKTPSGYELKRTSLFTNPNIGAIELTHPTAPGQEAKFKMGGYSHDQITALKETLAKVDVLLGAMAGVP